MGNSIRIALVLLAIASPGWAATYYVATDGDDSRTTTQAQVITTPWLTLQRASNSVVAGDIVYIRAGTYASFYIADKDGTSESPITFSGYESEEVIVEGSSAVTGWALHAGAIYVADFSSTYLSSQPHPEYLSGNLGFVNVDRTFDFSHWLEPKATLVEMAAGTWFYDEGVSPKKLYVWLTDSSDPSGHTILSTPSYAACEAVWFIRSSYITVTKMILQAACAGVKAEGNNESSYVTVDNVEIRGCQCGYLTDRPNHHFTLQSSHIHHTELKGLQINGNYSSVLDSEINNTGISGAWGIWAGSCTLLGGNYNVMSGNYIHDCPDYGVFVEAWGISGPGQEDGFANTVSRNRFDIIDGTAMACSGCDSAAFLSNTIKDSTYGINFEIGGSAGGMTEAQKLANDGLVYGNTIVDCTTNGIAFSEYVRNLTLKNNIVVNTPESIRPYPNSAKDYYTSDYNDFYLSTLGTLRWNGVTYTSLAAYQVASGQDAHSIGTDPLMVSASDYHLQGASPAKGAGLNLGTGYTDYDGVSLPTPYGWCAGALCYNSFGGTTGSMSGSMQ